MPENDPITVCCALIEHKGKILIAQRGREGSNAGKWEFPGGKQEAAETAEDCLKREIREELSVEISINNKLPEVIHQYPDKAIRLVPFICNFDGTHIICTEHEKVHWISRDEFENFTWSEADIKVWQHYLSFISTQPRH